MGSRKIPCALLLLFVFHVQADFGIPGYSFRNFDMTANETARSDEGSRDFVVDGDGNIIDDKKIVEEVEESCDPEVCMSAIKKKTAKHHEDNTTVVIDAVNASKDAPSNDLEVVVTEALLEEPPKHHGRKSIKSKKNCHAGHQYSKLPKFNYNYKEVYDYCEFRNILSPVDAKFISEKMSFSRTTYVGKRDRIIQTFVTKWFYGANPSYLAICPIDSAGECIEKPTTLDPNTTGNEEVHNSLGAKAKVIVNMFAPEYNREVSAICVLKKSRGKKVNKSFNRDSSKVSDANVQEPQQKAPKKPVV